MNISDDLSSDDVTAISFGLYHTAKSNAVRNKEPNNAVEFTLTEHAAEAFGTYLSSMRKSVQILTEKS